MAASSDSVDSEGARDEVEGRRLRFVTEFANARIPRSIVCPRWWLSRRWRVWCKGRQPTRGHSQEADLRLFYFLSGPWVFVTQLELSAAGPSCSIPGRVICTRRWPFGVSTPYRSLLMAAVSSQVFSESKRKMLVLIHIRTPHQLNSRCDD